MLSDRLKQIIDYKGISSRAFAIKIGSSSQSFGKYLQDREPSASVLSSIVETFSDINAAWLLTGEGEMLKTEPPKIGSQQSSEMVAMPRELLDLLLSQQKTIEAQQRITESQQGNFAKLTEAVLAQQQTISELSKKGATADNAMVAVG